MTVGNGFDYSRSGAYSHVSVFFLLGDKTATPTIPVAAPTGKGNAKVDPAANISTNSKEPVLTKLVLPRLDLSFIEKKLRHLRDKLIVDASTKKLQSIVSSINQESATLIIMFIDLLRVGIIESILKYIMGS